MGITIFTPTYNRAYILEQLYKSLCRQTNKNFEWLIIDDGSSDNTASLVQHFINEKKIKIKYYYQDNSGKALAYNKAIKLSEKELFTCVDSDDYLTDEAIEMILSKWKQVAHTEIGIVAKRIGKQGQDITKSSLKDGEKLNLREAYQKKKLTGDTFLIFNTKRIKKFFFPKIDNEIFFPEDYIYDQVNQEGKLIFFNKSLYVCEYLKDGYTKNINKIIAKNPKGYRKFLQQRLKLNKNIKYKILDLIRYMSISFVLKEGYIHPDYKLLSVLMFFPGYLIYRKRFRKYK